jgi:hypothetical protein
MESVRGPNGEQLCVEVDSMGRVQCTECSNRTKAEE